MGSKSTLAIIGFALAALLAAIFKELYWAAVVEWVFDHTAAWLGVEKATMLANLTPFVLALLVASVAVTAAYQIGVRDRKAKPALKILFNNSAAHVEIKKGLHGPTGEFYSIALENIGTATVSNVVLRVLDSWFTREIIATAQYGQRLSFPAPVVIFEMSELHPNTAQYRQVFGLSYVTETDHPDYILNKPHSFVIEANGKDTPAVKKTFQYDPNTRPMLKMIN